MASKTTRRSTALQPGRARTGSTAVAGKQGDERVTLNGSEKALLDEALEQCRQAADEVQDRMVTLGVWLLRHVFHGDARAALGGGGGGAEGEVAPSRQNLVWRELVRRAGGPTLRLSPRMLSVAVRAAAWDRLIPDESWRSLDAGRKELLLPLGEPDLLREGAQHVVAMRLTQRATRSYVQATLAAYRGRPAERRVTPRQVAATLRRTRQDLTEAAMKRRIKQFAERYGAGERKKLAVELDALIEALRGLKRELG